DSYEGQIDNPLSLNLYTYVSNNPLTSWDPTGHCSCMSPTNPSNVTYFGAGYSAYRSNPNNPYILDNDPYIDPKTLLPPSESTKQWIADEQQMSVFQHIPDENEPNVTTTPFQEPETTIIQNFNPTPGSNKQLADDISGRYGGTLSDAKGDGYTVTIPITLNDKSANIVLRVMNTSKLNNNYWRMSISGKGTMDKNGNLSGDADATHVPIGENSYEDLTNIIDKYVKSIN
ncbi:hypothetical protein ABRS97_27900, partial [Paenibacillus sp. SI92]